MIRRSAFYWIGRATWAIIRMAIVVAIVIGALAIIMRAL
jgi:hypothetical protein